jgi:hypothetical protein
MRYLRHCVYIALGFALSAIPLTTFAKTIECGSKNYRYRYCRVNTDGYVRLERRLSDAPCKRGRSWGYDDDGVWVDEGCQARFKVGRYHNDNEDNDGKKKLLTTAAVIGGLALLGTIMSKNNTPADAGNQHPYPEQYPNNNTSGGGHYGGPVPNWIAGTFRGYDSLYNIDLELTITPDGAVNGYANQAAVQGNITGDQMQIGQFTFYVDQVPDGFRATRVDDAHNQIFFQRTR